jgi:hypothetical protein
MASLRIRSRVGWEAPPSSAELDHVDTDAVGEGLLREVALSAQLDEELRKIRRRLRFHLSKIG